MDIGNVLTIVSIMGAIICGLIGIIYKILNGRIDVVSKSHNNLAVDISAIRTNICWIKKKLDKI